MIIKGKSRGNGGQLGAYLITVGENEEVRLIEIRGVAASDVPGAVREMEALASGTRAQKSLYHAQINSRKEERMTEAQRLYAVDRLEKELGFTNQPRVIVVHVKDGREHTHVVWSRIDIERMRAIPDSFNYRGHEQVARDLEREFGHERVQGVFVDRDGKPRPDRTPSRADMQQAARTGIPVEKVKDDLTRIWHATGTGQEFAGELEKAGYVLARGDRRDFVVIDQKGGIHSLTRRIDGVRVKDVRERLSDIEPARLPGIDEAKRRQRAGQGIDLSRFRAQDFQRDDAKHRPALYPDWTQKGGMVDQQRSAMHWLEKAQTDRRVRTEQTDRRAEQSDASALLQQRRQDLLRELGREITQEADVGRERGPSR